MVVPDPGMKIRKNTMTDKTEIVRRHVEAVTQMLLGNRTLMPGAMVVAGEVTGGDGPIVLAQMAQSIGKDIVFLAFGDTESGYALVDITIVAVRNGICHVQPGCRLYLSKAGARAIILPQPHVRGHFRLAPSELVQRERKPDDIANGVARAEAQLAHLVDHGVQLGGRAVINTYPMAV